MIPHQRSLVKRLEGKPFALIGVNTDSDQAMVQSQSKVDRVTWRSFYDRTTRGPISRDWKVNGFPTTYIIDAHGVIRYKNLSGKEIGRAVDKLLAELEQTTQ